MGSLAQGILRVLAWFDSTDDELKPVINDDGLMPVTVDNMPTAIQSQMYSYISSAWQKNPLIWGYSAAVISYQGVVDAVVNTNTFIHPGPAAGEIWKLTRVLAVNLNTNPSQIKWELRPSAGAYRFHTASSPGVNVYDEETIDIIATELHDIACVVEGCTLNDNVYTYLYGYKMKIEL